MRLINMPEKSFPIDQMDGSYSGRDLCVLEVDYWTSLLGRKFLSYEEKMCILCPE